MSKHIPRRNVLKLLGAGAAATWIGRPLLLATDQDVRIAGKLTRIFVLPLGEHSIRITISEQANGAVDPALDDGVIIPTAASASETKAQRTQNSAGNSLQVHVTQSPLTIQIENRAHRTIQLLKIDEQIGS